MLTRTKPQMTNRIAVQIKGVRVRKLAKIPVRGTVQKRDRVACFHPLLVQHHIPGKNSFEPLRRCIEPQ